MPHTVKHSVDNCLKYAILVGVGGEIIKDKFLIKWQIKKLQHNKQMDKNCLILYLVFKLARPLTCITVASSSNILT